MKICYNGKSIDLFYFPWFPRINNKKEFLKIRVKGIGNQKIKPSEEQKTYSEVYEIVEEEAQIYLIKNAMDKGRAEYALEKIVAITQDLIFNPSKEYLELEIILTGLAFFKK